jgi:YfiH family protein
MAEERPLPGDPPRWELTEWRDRFGVTAGITARGTDAEPFDLGLWSATPVADTMSRWRQFGAAFPDFAGQVMAHQVHGDRVLWHRASEGWTIHAAADGHATDQDGLLLLVTVADCVPIYLVAPRHGAIALLHSGWRGTAQGILARGVALLEEKAGAGPGDLVMHAGVAISGPRYEVGREVVEGVGLTAVGAGPWHVDLRDRLADAATRLGIGEISLSPHCTAEPGGPFFSHRGSGGADGRMVAWLGRLPTG